MVAYTQTIPGTDVTFEMVPIAGGSFLMGSPADEADRNEDEGPQAEIQVPTAVGLQIRSDLVRIPTVHAALWSVRKV